MVPPPSSRNSLMRVVAWSAAAVAALLLAWVIPVNLRSLTPALLHEAGRDSNSVSKLGILALESEKLGASRLFLQAAQAVKDPGAINLENQVKSLESRRPEWIPWGGWDPFLDPLFKLKEVGDKKESTPVLQFFVTGKARSDLKTFLGNSRSLGVLDVLQTRTIDQTTRLVPAERAGGQTLDAVILLTALLYQSENLSPALQREVRALASKAIAQKQMGALETFYIDLLSLGKRLNWVQLCELLRTTKTVKSVAEYAHLSRVAPDRWPVIYSAALAADSAEKVASYLIEYGTTGADDLTLALTEGQGAVQLLLLSNLPVNRASAPALGPIAEFALLNPRIALIIKYLGFLACAFFSLRALECAIDADHDAPIFRLKSSLLAMVLGGMLITASEPFLLRRPPVSEYRIRIVLPALTNQTLSTEQNKNASTLPSMDSSTLLSIAFFASLQITMYLVCLRKIREISRQPVSPIVKLKLMENEENLFDGGLYVGIGGTATALVLQVLGVIQPNLLAAYSSNLFGITCVALVKIRSVRLYKRALILEIQQAQENAAQVTTKTS